MRRLFTLYIPAVSFLVAIVVLFLYADSLSLLTDLMSGNDTVGYFAYVFFLVVAVVAMPLTVVPIIPLASALFGPFATAILSIIGWTIGGVIAFAIARYLGRPFILRFVSLEKVDTIGARIPPNARFLVIVLLRLTLPVDVVSYALGLSPVVGLLEYTAATFIGVIWFSFAFAYLGDAVLTGNTFLIIELGAASILVFILGWYALRRSHRATARDIRSKKATEEIDRVE